MQRSEVWQSGRLMAALGALIGAREVGARLAELAEQYQGFAGGPAPRALDWISGTALPGRLLAALDRGLLLGILVLTGRLIWRLARLLNPAGTLLAPQAGDQPLPADWRRLPLEPSMLRRAFAAGLVTLYLGGGVGALIGALDLEPPSATWGLFGPVFFRPDRPWVRLVAAFALCGAAIWLLWGEGGVLRTRRVRASDTPATLLRGLIAGVAAFPALLPLLPWGRGLISLFQDAVGPAQPAPWHELLWGLALGLPVAFFLLGLLGHGLARPGTAPVALLLVSSFGLSLLGAGEALFLARLVRRYDAGRDLAALVGAAHHPSGVRTFLLFPPAGFPGPAPGLVPLMTIEQIDAGAGSPRRTWEYLQRRKYQCAAAGEALVHLHDCASLRWDSAESLRVDLASLEQHPAPIFAHLLLEKLFTCATSAENRALLRQAADPARFRPDPAWRRDLGLLYRRFGDLPAASRLLRQAGLNGSELQKALAREPLTDGAISGQLIVNGRPGAGLTAGVLPAGPWQSLVGTPAPFELRRVAAAAPTDAAGRFHLRDLAEGHYLLIVMGDPARLPVQGFGTSADARPGALHLDHRRPSYDLGVIHIRTVAPARSDGALAGRRRAAASPDRLPPGPDPAKPSGDRARHSPEGGPVSGASG